MSSDAQQGLIESILHTIAQDDFVLPTLPSIALKLQDLINDPNVSADQIVTVLSSDPAVSAQIIRSANSAAFSGKPAVSNIREAASRLGYRQLHNLVISITMNNLFSASNPVICEHLKQVWDHSRKVAAISYVLATQHRHLSADEAMLAGLMHNIGELPLYLQLERKQVYLENDALTTLIRTSHRAIGARLLKQWHFSPTTIEVLLQHEELHAATERSQADYVDVVSVANLLDSPRMLATRWNDIAAVGRLGLNEEGCRNFLIEHAEHIERVEVLLGMKQRNKPAATPAAPEPKPVPVAPVITPAPATGMRAWLSRMWN